MNDLAVIHNALLAAGLPVVSVESPDGRMIGIVLAAGSTPSQQEQADAIAAQFAALPVPDYERFKDLLRGGGLFATALGTTQEKAWTVLLSTIESKESDSDPGRLADFAWSLSQVIAGLPAPLSAPQLQRLNEILTMCGFGFQL